MTPRARSVPPPTWAWAPALAGLVLTLVVLPPFVPAPLRAALYAAFSPVCHQLGDRSFHVAGEAFAVCHRCTGIFAGLVVGALAWPFVRPFADALARRAPLVLAAALAPTALDWAVGVAGVWTNTPASRTLTGALFGAAAGVYLARGFADFGASKAPVAPVSLSPSHSTHPPA